ncbi:hypothetical protein MRB53_041384 [Persea americana]|nr:hypothetical protein MRB53_041384 [Persea americana]
MQVGHCLYLYAHAGLTCRSDEIISSLNEAKEQFKSVPSRVFDENIDAAQTIALCAQHQKRIVDDILTLSKLDSALLMVAPVDVQPLAVVQRALKMFEGELQSSDIKMKFIVDPSFQRLGVDWINLTTNAIKFAKQQSIDVLVAASTRRFSDGPNPIVTYFPSRSKRPDLTLAPDWGTGETIYLQFAVRDTGRGLTEDEKKVLFQRFSQASPRTHVTYGVSLTFVHLDIRLTLQGSGLGLFISRELSELQAARSA